MRNVSFRDREYTPPELVEGLMLALIVFTWVIVLYYARFTPWDRPLFGIFFLCTMIVIFILAQMKTSLDGGSRMDLVMLTLMAVTSIILLVYMVWQFEALTYVRLGFALSHELVLGAMFILTVTYLTYRAYGLVFMFVVVFVIFYGWAGPIFPGLFRHGGFGITTLINGLVWEFQFQGMFGSINQIVATWVSLFLLYAGLLRGYGAFDLILRAAIRTAKYVESGVAQSAVTASLIIGSITGSQMANAAITGSFTIPMMKDSGIASETAGAIEAVASSGGQVMPPVMGAAAFVMASILGVGYLNVMLAGVIPALLFYITVIIAVHYAAVAQLQNKATLDMSVYLDEVKSRREIGIEIARFLVPFFVLVWALGIARWTVMTAAFWTVILMLITGIGVPLAQTAVRDPSEIGATTMDMLGRTVSGFRYGAITMAPIAIVIGAINGVVDLLVVTGVPGKFSLALLGISGGILLVAVIMSMIICIILGLGMPTVAAYVIVAFLIAPALIGEFLVPALAAHYFVFYAAMLSGLTPPIAIAVVVTTGIAGSNFWVTCYQAIKISAVLFILPFVFIYNPEIIIGGFSAWTFGSGFIAFLGGVAVIHGINFFRRPLSIGYLTYVLRFAFVAAGTIAMVHPTTTIRIAAVGVAVALFLAQRVFISPVELPQVEEPTAATGN